MVLQKLLFRSVFCITLFFCICLVAASEVKAPKFQVKPVRLNSKNLNVWWADTDKKRTFGMMFKTAWPEKPKKIEGMLFIFEGEKSRSFWMKNTPMSLDIGFFNAQGVLLEKDHLEGVRSISQTKVDRVQSKKSARYVLEVPQGWFKKHQVELGAKLKLL